MGRRTFIISLLAAATLRGDGVRLRGKLTTTSDGTPALKTKRGLVRLEGDRETAAVLGDKRLRDADFEVAGKFLANGRFRVNPIHTKAMWVYHDGKRHTISYWCDVCSIRSYTPGICWCCQQETKLDLREDKDEQK